MKFWKINTEVFKDEKGKKILVASIMSALKLRTQGATKKDKKILPKEEFKMIDVFSRGKKGEENINLERTDLA